MLQEAEAARVATVEELHALREKIEKEHQDRLTEIHNAAIKSREDFEAASAKRKTQHVLSSLESMSAGVAQHSKAMFKLNKAASLAQAAVSLPSAILESFRNNGGWPWGAAAAAAMAAAGAAQIQAIRNTNFEGGGAGTTPSAAATPVVNGQPVQSQHLVVEGLSRDSLFSGEAVRELAGKLLQHQKDGGEVVFRD